MPKTIDAPTHFFFFVCAVFILACSSTPEYTPPTMQEVPDHPLPESRYQSGFRFTYNGEVTSAEAVSEDITIAVVDPFYLVDESIFKNTNATAKQYRPVGKGFSSSMGVDMQKILVGKGMTVKGPFSVFDDITYSEKKNSHLTLTPELFVDVRSTYVSVEQDDGNMSEPEEFLLGGKHEEENAWAFKTFELTVNGYFSFRMQEPMSEETMWIKKIPLEEVVRRGLEVYEAAPNYNTGYYVVREDKVLVDQRADTLADIMADYYQLVLTKLQDYIDIEELYELKKKTAEIRERKRY